MTTRREFLKTGAAAGALMAAGSPALARAAERIAAEERARVAPMNILIFGGTGFIGPHLVRHAVSRGHNVTIFSRGRRDADIPASVQRLIGDRAIDSTTSKGNLTALEGKKFDAVIDDPATDPRWVQQAVDTLRTSGQYLFVSSTGVYLPYRTENADENAPRPLVPERGGPPQYGNQKAASENIVLETFKERGTVVRPAYIIGPGDTSDRFGYWPQRLAKGGETLAPGRKTERIAIVDVRDLAAFMIKLVEDRKGGAYNVTGPEKPTTMEEFLTRAKKVMNSNSEFVWIDDYDFLRAHGIGQMVPWTRLDGDNLYHTVLSNKKALDAGLKLRPFEETIKDFWAWWPERLKLLQPGQQPNFQLRQPGGRGRGAEAPTTPRLTTEEYEKQVIAEWKAR
jgi:2'-hydroxyisoflavone reductase